MEGPTQNMATSTLSKASLPKAFVVKQSRPQNFGAKAFSRFPAEPRRSFSFRPRASAEESSEAGPSSAAAPPPPVPVIPPNKAIAGGAAGFAIAAFISLRVLGGGPSLASLAATSIPLDIALASGKPTVVEFYADWCEACKEMSPTVFGVEKEFREKVNFVMLNIDNSKWDDEVDQYGVEGIPHFVFLSAEGREAAEVVGRLPPGVLKANVEALAQGETQLPYQRVSGMSAALATAPPVSTPKISDPRAHGWQ